MRRLDLEGASMGFAEVTEALRRNPQHTREALNIVVSCLYATKNSAAFVQFAIRRYIAAAVTIQRLVRKTIASMRADIYRELSRWIAHDQEASDAIIQRAVDGSRTPQESRHPDSADEAFLHFDIHLRQEVVEIFYKKQRDEFRGKLREWGEQLQRLRAEEASARTDLANRVRNAETNQSNEMSMRGEMSRVGGASWLQGGTHGVEGSLRLLGLSGLEDGGNGMGVPPIIASLEELVTSIQTKIYRHKQRRPRFEFSAVFSDLRALAQERYTEAAGRRVAAVMGHLGISGDADVPQEQPSPYSSPKRRPRPSSATRMSIEFNEMFDNRSSGNSPTHHLSMKRPHYSPRQSFSASKLNHALYTSVLARSEMLKDTKGPRTSFEVGGGWRHSHTSPSTPRTPSRPHPELRVPMGSALADGLLASKAGISSSAKRCYASLGLSLDVLQPVNTSTSHVSSVKHLTPEPAGYDEDGVRNSVVDRYAYLMEGRGDDECGESLRAPTASFKWQAGSRRQTFPHAPSSARIVRQSIYEPTAQTSQPASTAPSKISRTSSVVSSVLAPSRPSASRDAPRRRVMSAAVGSRTVVVAADAPQVSVVRPSHTLLNARDLVLAEEADARAHKMAASTHNFVASPRTNKAAILREELRYHREWPLKPPVKHIPGWCDTRRVTTHARDPLAAAESHLKGLLAAKAKAEEKLEVLRAAQGGEIQRGTVGHANSDDVEEMYHYHHFYSVPSVLRGNLQDPERQLEKLELEIRMARTALEEEVRKGQLVLARPRVISLGPTPSTSDLPVHETVSIHKHLLRNLYPDDYYSHRKKVQQGAHSHPTRMLRPKTTVPAATASIEPLATAAIRVEEDIEHDNFELSTINIAPVLEKYGVSEETKMVMQAFDVPEHRRGATEEAKVKSHAPRRSTKNRAPSSAALKSGIETQALTRCHVGGVAVVTLIQVYENAIVKGSSTYPSDASESGVSKRSQATAISAASYLSSKKIGFASSFDDTEEAPRSTTSHRIAKGPSSTSSARSANPHPPPPQEEVVRATISLVASGSFDGGLRITALPNNLELFHLNAKDAITSIEAVRPTAEAANEVSALVVLSDDKCIRIVRRGKKQTNEFQSHVSNFEQYASEVAVAAQNRVGTSSTRSKTVGLDLNVSLPSKAPRAPVTPLAWSTHWYLHATIRLPGVPLSVDFFTTTPPPSVMNGLFKCYASAAAAIQTAGSASPTIKGPSEPGGSGAVSSGSSSPVSSKKKPVSEEILKRRATILEQLTTEFRNLMRQLESSFQLLVVGGYDCVVRLLPLDFDIPVAIKNSDNPLQLIPTQSSPPLFQGGFVSPQLSFASPPRGGGLTASSPPSLLQKDKSRLLLSVPGGSHGEVSPSTTSLSRGEGETMSMVSFGGSALAGGGGKSARQRLRARTAQGNWAFKHPYNHHHVISEIEDNRYGTEDGRSRLSERSEQQRDIVAESDALLASIKRYANRSGTKGAMEMYPATDFQSIRRESQENVDFRRVSVVLTLDGHVLGVTKVRAAGDDLVISTGLDSQCFVFRILSDTTRRAEELILSVTATGPEAANPTPKVLPPLATSGEDVPHKFEASIASDQLASGSVEEEGALLADAVLSKQSTFMTGVETDSDVVRQESMAPTAFSFENTLSLLLEDNAWLCLDSARPFTCHNKGVTDMIIVPTSTATEEHFEATRSQSSIMKAPLERRSTMVCTASLDCTVAVWDALALDLRHKISFSSPVRAPLKINPNFGVVICCLENASVVCWSAVSGSVLSETSHELLQDPCLACTTIGKHTVALGTYGGRLLLLNSMTGAIFGSKVVHGGAITDLAAFQLLCAVKEDDPKVPAKTNRGEFPREMLVLTSCDDRNVGCHHVSVASDPVLAETLAAS